MQKHFCFLSPSDSYEGTFVNKKNAKKLLHYIIMGDKMSPENPGVFQLLKEVNFIRAYWG